MLPNTPNASKANASGSITTAVGANFPTFYSLKDIPSITSSKLTKPLKK